MKTITSMVLILFLGLSDMAMARGGGGAGTGVGLSAYSYPTYYRYRAYYQRHRQARQFAHNNHDKSALLKKKTVVGYGMARQDTKAENYHSRTTGADAHPYDSTSPDAFIKQIPRDRTATLLPGRPLLGLDLRSPSTWTLYSQMLPFIFSEQSVPTSNEVSAP